MVGVRAHFPVTETDDATCWSGGEVLMRRKLRVLVTGQTPRLDVLTRLSSRFQITTFVSRAHSTIWGLIRSSGIWLRDQMSMRCV